VCYQNDGLSGMSRLNAMQLCLSPDKGGLELYVAKLAGFLDNEVELSVVLADKSDIFPYFSNIKNPIYQVRRKLKSAIKIAKIIDKDNIDIVHVHWTKDLPVAVLAKILSKKKPKLIQTRHMEMTLFKNDFYHRFIYKNIDLMIAVTKQVKEQIEKFITPAPQVVLSYIGVEKKPKISVSALTKLRGKYHLNAKFIACIVGRIEHEKGQHVVIDAVDKLLKQGVDIQLIIIGDTMTQTYLKDFKNNINHRGLDEKIILTGFLSNAHEVIQLCDALILATRKETFGMVLVEAMQAAICVIASDRGGPLEIIDNNKTGLLFKSFDSDALCEKILNLYQHSDLKALYALAGQKKAEDKFNDVKQFNEILANYQSIIKS
jgi:glycosyltransferase involved in cell wall biosynthesis